jgi:hypothetical protein
MLVMVIHGIDNLTLDDIEREVDAGGRFVFYEYCISLIVASSRRPSDIFFLRADDWGIVRGLWYCLLSLLFGWWGIHWGLIYTPLTLFNNLGGGCDVTSEVLNVLQAQAAPPDEAGPEGRIPCEEP